MLYFDKKATFRRKGTDVVNGVTKKVYIDTYTLIPANFERASGKLPVLNQLSRENIVDQYVLVVELAYNDILPGDEVYLYDVIGVENRLKGEYVVGSFDYQPSITGAIDCITISCTRRDG